MDRSQDEENHLPDLLRLLDVARSAGAVAAEVLATETVRHSAVGGRSPHIRRQRSVNTSGVVYLDGGRKQAFSVDALGEAAVRSGIKSAVTRARRAALNPLAAPADRYAITLRGLGIEDPRYRHIQDADRLDVLQSNEAACNAVEGVSCSRVGYYDTRRVRTFASSKGVEASSADTTYEVSLAARDTTNGRELEQVVQARNFANAGSLPYGVDLARRLEALRDTREMPPGLPALVLSGRVMASILEGLAPAFSGPLVRAGKSFLANYIDKPVGHTRVHLIDDASLHGGLLTRAFDDRGVAPMPMPVLREGRLGGLYQDPESARDANARPTGHVFGGGLTPSNLVLRAGKRSRTQMLGEVPLALLFDHIKGSLDVRNGQLRFEGPAFVLERGQRKGVVPRVLLHGSVVDLLLGVVEVASDQERNVAVDCATTLVKGFEVSAPA